MPIEGKSIFVVIPVYNMAKTIEDVYRRIPMEYVDEVIILDDCSRDNTYEVSLELGATVIKHPKNLGYGAAQKTLYKKALEKKADVVVLIHGDGQYEPEDIPKFIQPIIEGEVDFTLGSRFKNGAPLKGGMPIYKFFANRFLTECENLALKLKLSEYHCGYRAYSKKFLELVPFEKNSDDFIFDQEIIFQARFLGFKIKEIPVKTIYTKESSQLPFKNSVIYGLKIIRLIIKNVLQTLNL
jgi:glycosyltransferase involved in cell wall biosynthesis